MLAIGKAALLSALLAGPFEPGSEEQDHRYDNLACSITFEERPGGRPLYGCRTGMVHDSGRIAARSALGAIGEPYVWGGGGPKGATTGVKRGNNVKGFDCAGLTEYAWAQAGIDIGPDTYAQWRSGPRVARRAMRPGDLAFFETDAKRRGPDHVGVAINVEQMVVAPFTGASVRIEKIDRRSFAGAVRPVEDLRGDDR
ncbi:hypothetical protein GCM10022248_24950 [Nonomuraea soli]